MKKILKTVLIIIAVILIIFIVLPFLFGFMSTANPSKAANAAKCANQCFEKYSEDNQTCKEDCLKSIEK